MIGAIVSGLAYIGERPGKSFLVMAGVILTLIVGLRLYTLQMTVNDQAEALTTLQAKFTQEQATRKADNRGLTTLLDGVRVDQIKNDQDTGALEHAVTTAPKTGLSPFMRAYFDCLRRQAAGAASCSGSAVGSAPAK